MGNSLRSFGVEVRLRSVLPSPTSTEAVTLELTWVFSASCVRTWRKVSRMDQANLTEHLSRISTLWSMVFQAHAEPVDAATAARQRLLQRYHGAAYRYLLGA